MVFAKDGSGFHYPLAEVKADILLPIPCPDKSEATPGTKDGARCSSKLANHAYKTSQRIRTTNVPFVPTFFKSNS